MASNNPRKNAEGYNDPTPYEAEKRIRAQLQGKRARAAGGHFEAMISASCDYYLSRDIAKIEKTPEPMKPLGAKNRQGHFMACYTKQAQPDYGGTMKGGRSIYFEAKHTDDNRIEQRRLTAEQADDLEAHHKLGAITFVLVSFGLRAFYRVPWPVWRDMAETYGRKYIKQEELKTYEVPAVAGYIKLLENLPPETITIGRIGEDELNRIRQVLDDSPGILLPGEGAAP
ncbi:Holliday junction resolvase RecU [Oscillibacter sp.]|uniref:Holliday junction resolvase RecU n=1 Tax=Oscillibacter sp. TaxID=1945593 RepID=UPI00258747C2|nr:Holliday junction resolvase RecU [Oscillibacter sp.]